MHWIPLNLTWQIYIYIEQCRYTHDRLTPWPIKHRYLGYHYTKLGTSIYIEQCIYTHSRLTPQPIKNRCLEYHYTKLGTSHGRTMHIYPWQMNPSPSKSSIDALNTTTSNLADLSLYIEQGIYTHGRLPPWPIEHRCLEYCYTKLGISIYIEQMHIYLWQINPLCNQA